MITALIFAGGTGQRMKTTDKPKQFLELHGKPIIIYTIEHFEKNNQIDNIIVVCIENYIDELKLLLKHFHIHKVKTIIAGSPDGGDYSIYNGLKVIHEFANDDDIVLIHDGVRPLINEKLINENIDTAKKYGNSISVDSTTESVVQISSSGLINVPPRNEMYNVKAPQVFRFSLIWELHQKAQADGIRSIDSAHLCSIYGTEMHFVKSPSSNIKITMPQDYYIFRALFEAKENKQLLEDDSI